MAKKEVETKDSSPKKSNRKQLLVIGGLVVVALIGLGVFKEIVLNQPKETPQQITQKLVDYIQKDKQTDKDKEQIAAYYNQAGKDKINKLTSDTNADSSDSTTKPVITVKSVQVDKNTATSTIELSAWIINVPVQFKFVKEGNYLTGYSWKISDVIGVPGDTSSSSSKIESTVKPGVKTSIGDKWFITVSAPSDYAPASEWEQPKEGNKLVAVEVEYFNNSAKSDTANPSNLTLRDSESHTYEMSFMSSKKPDFSGSDTVTAGGNLKGWITYEVPTAAKITKAVYANSFATVTIKY